MRVDDDGIELRGPRDEPIDVLFDGRAIFSFWLERDTEPVGRDRLLRWPGALKRFLDGHCTVELVQHGADEPFWSQQVRLGSGEQPIRVEDAHGNPMGLDKSLRLTRLFGSRSAEQLEPLLDSIATVLDAVAATGLEPFLAYGTLLGAVRDGSFIGHDSDADIGYVSRYEHPFDAIRESFRVQRALIKMGYRTTRYSGLAFKVRVLEADGRPRGLDVFGGLMIGDHLYLMGEVGHPFRREWIFPLGETTLEGRTYPAPARPEMLLEAMYGPSWRVPDPAYKFTTPASTSRRLSGWFRGTRVGLDRRWTDLREGRAALPDGGKPGIDDPSDFIRWVRECEPDAATVIDVGCGRGTDVLWLAGQGIEARGLDYFPRAFRPAARVARANKLPARFNWTNLDEMRSTLVTGARMSRLAGPRVVTARHVVDDTDATGRDSLLRIARMVTRDSGALYVQMRNGPTRKDPERPGGSVAQFLAQVEDLGGELDHREDLVDGSTNHDITRLVIRWHRRT